MVDWSPGANDVMYIKAAANIRVVGAVTANMLKALKDGQSLSYQDVHMIGHSLGAHTCGYVGRRERGIGRITGMSYNCCASFSLPLSMISIGANHNCGFGLI